MNTNAGLQLVNEGGWRSGFANLWRKESQTWWGSKRWIWQSLLWIVLVNGLLALVIWAFTHTHAQNANQALGSSLYEQSMIVFVSIALAFTALGAIVMTQGKIIGERQSGTAAWILSKPVSRSAFILTKFATLIPGMLIATVALPGVVAYLQIALATGQMPSIGTFLAAAGVLAFNVVFFFSLTLMLGAIFKSRAWVIGIMLIIIELMQQFEWNNLVPVVVRGQALPSLLAMLVMVCATGVCIIVAIKRFEREEF
jgi:ABC-2 type transport system permease protein